MAGNRKGDQEGAGWPFKRKLFPQSGRRQPDRHNPLVRRRRLTKTTTGRVADSISNTGIGAVGGRGHIWQAIKTKGGGGGMSRSTPRGGEQAQEVVPISYSLFDNLLAKKGQIWKGRPFSVNTSTVKI